jgi:hypothetical protein
MKSRSYVVRSALAVSCTAAIFGAAAIGASAASTRIPAPPTPRPTHLAPPMARAARLRITHSGLVVSMRLRSVSFR